MRNRPGGGGRTDGNCVLAPSIRTRAMSLVQPDKRDESGCYLWRKRNWSGIAGGWGKNSDRGVANGGRNLCGVGGRGLKIVGGLRMQHCAP